MNTRVSWGGELGKIALVLAAATLLGWFVGKVLLVLVLTLFAILAYWLAQLSRIHKWLAAPGLDPPESVGLWGDVFDKIYTLRRQTQEAHAKLQSTVDYLQDSFASMKDGVVILDASAVIQWSNEAAQALLGLRYPADKGQGVLNLLRAPEFHQYFIAGNYTSPLQLATTGEPTRQLRIEITCFGEGDKLMFIRDITQLQRLEQMRRDFVGNVSHELRTPLTVISGYLGTLIGTENAVAPRFVKPLKQMEQQAQRMESLLKDLLWLSRLESVENTNRNELIDISALLKELQTELSSSYPGRTIELQLATGHKVPGDHRELYSAVSNLVINALKYSPEQSPVRVSWVQCDEHYLLTVIDQGVGIDASHLPRLTERFYRVDDSRSSATGGTGLGLAIVKHVAAGHGAELRIESVVGVGSKFILVF